MNRDSLRNFYDQKYRSPEKTFPDKPDRVVKSLLQFVRSGHVYDIGAGEGGNTEFLALNGFKVTAVELSPVGAKKIEDVAQKMNLPINVEVGDMTSINFPNDCEIFLSTFVLHYLTRDEGEEFLRRMREATPVGGINVISAWMNNTGFYGPDHEGKFSFFRDGELRNMYLEANWEVLDYSQSPSQSMLLNSQGQLRSMETASIIAKKV